MLSPLEHRYVIRMRVDATSYQDASARIIHWAREHKNVYVCAANVHMDMETWDSDEFANVVNNAALVTPDGMPLVWALKALGVSDASRVYGPTLTLHVCEAAALEGVPIALYGGTPESLEAFSSFLEEKYTGINIACRISPPFRPLTKDEDEEYTKQIIDSGAQILFVGIGCPKQEYWMFSHQKRIPAVMLGVGAAFDFHSGRVQQAPPLLQKLGLEWAFRFAMEPGRLWKRYVYNNPRFIILFLLQWLSSLVGIRLYQSRADI
ncbi:MAG: WecB/TagA/CpsF family glycosyltransferase [Cyanobacteria bacterium P01_F01_bin.150]